MAPSGLMTVVGGKLTTARIMAVRVIDQAIPKIGKSDPWLPSQTHKLSIGGTNEEVAEGLAYWVRQCPQLTGLFQNLVSTLRSRRPQDMCRRNEYIPW